MENLQGSGSCRRQAHSPPQQGQPQRTWAVALPLAGAVTTGAGVGTDWREAVGTVVTGWPEMTGTSTACGVVG